MTFQKHLKTLFITVLYLCSTFESISADQDCDKSKCQGPIRYYEDLQCTPIYGPDDNCCPIKYNCDQYKGRPKDKCFMKGHEYAIGETLKPEHARPCDQGCFCSEGPTEGEAAKFICAIVDCFEVPQPGCYLKHSHDKCCGGPSVCPETGMDLPKCVVDGTTYLDGQFFTPMSDSKKTCICAEGYTGENIEPFCKNFVDAYPCNVELRHSNDIYSNCAPVFHHDQNPATDCNRDSRCQNSRDVVVVIQNSTSSAAAESKPDTDSMCVFGDMTMRIGDQLNQGTHYDSVCVKCVCEVPPYPTCKRQPDSECDITVHDDFSGLTK